MTGWIDELSKLTNNSKIDDRARNLIWLRLSNYDYEYFIKNPLTVDRSEIYRYIRKNSGALLQVQIGFNNGFLIDKHLD